jgi:hypothetical protein
MPVVHEWVLLCGVVWDGEVCQTQAMKRVWDFQAPLKVSLVVSMSPLFLC